MIVAFGFGDVCVAIVGQLTEFALPPGLLTNVGVVAATGRLAFDLLAPRVSELWEFNQARRGGQWDEFQDWLTAQRLNIEPQEVVHTAVVEMRNGNTTHRLGLEGDELARAVEFAREYLAMDEPSTAESVWVAGKLWTGSRDQFIAWRDWCIDKGLAWRPGDGRGVWKFKAVGLHILRELAKMDLSPHPADAQ